MVREDENLVRSPAIPCASHSFDFLAIYFFHMRKAVVVRMKYVTHRMCRLGHVKIRLARGQPFSDRRHDTVAFVYYHSKCTMGEANQCGVVVNSNLINIDDEERDASLLDTRGSYVELWACHASRT